MRESMHVRCDRRKDCYIQPSNTAMKPKGCLSNTEGLAKLACKWNLYKFA